VHADDLSGCLNESGRGIKWIKNTYPMPTSEEREDAIEAAKVLLQIALHIEPLHPDGGHEMVSNISLIVSLMKEEHNKHVYDQVV